MSCEHEHHQHEAPPIETSSAQSLNNQIDFTKLTALNCTTPNSKLFEVFIHEGAESKITLSSDCDNQLILNIPFVSSVKLYSLILKTSPDNDHCPKKISLFKNADIDFESTAAKSTHHFEQPLVGEFVEHHLPRRLFTNVHKLTLFFEGNWSDDEFENLEILGIELRGEWAPLTKDPVITLYEAAANPADHKSLAQETQDSATC
ncbi:BA75_04926T0 [Komagataella pastoris]|uniref:BA75_04926T0 n=1 Tax=Komagataella pastoris TaxID=4922 RepID=A0A1B2JIP0_PICPA|nr:BA75_04926T0 [Komagataella pastoris]